MGKPRVIISGGGTGGHVFPAIATANAIRKKYPEAEILFIGAMGKMEMEKVPAVGYPIKGLWISGFQRNFSLTNFLLPLKVLVSLLHAAWIILHFKPQVVVGFGGYASGPTLRMASLLGIPTAIQEQNSIPGKTNQLLGKKAKAVFVAYDHMEKYFLKSKIIKTGNPVRFELIDQNSLRDEAFRYFGLDPAKKTLLIIGGSQGARTINLTLGNGLKELLSHQIQIIWQTGKASFETGLAALEQADINKNSAAVKVVEFIDRMDLAYACASAIVSRSGAMAIAELCMVGKPVILVPFPYAAEDHQTLNALSLVKNDAARMISNQDAPEKLISTILEILGDEKGSEEMASNLKKMAIPESAERIAGEIFKILKMS